MLNLWANKTKTLNEYALEIDIDKIAAGHTLDGEVTLSLINYINGNMKCYLKENIFAKNT